MKKIKISIIFLIILIIIILLALFYTNQVDENIKEEEIISNKQEILIDNYENISTQNAVVNNVNTNINTKEYSTEEIQEIVEYLSVKKCLNKYISEINVDASRYYTNNEEGYTKTVSDEVINTNIYNILSENYINKNSINIKNVRDFVDVIEQSCFIIPINIEKKQEISDVKTYYIYGVIETQSYEKVSEVYLILNICEQYQTFSVEPLNSREELLNAEYKELSEIPIKDNNVYTAEKNTIQNVIEEYSVDIKRLILGYTDLFYNHILDSEYKAKRFPSLESFKEYVYQNEKNIKGISIEKYRVLSRNDGNIYVVADQYNNVYVYKQNTNIWDYRVCLDNYTIMLDEYIESYNKLDKFDKAKYNLTKFINMVNTKDYNAIYSILDTTFRDNNFNNINVLKQYIPKNMYDLNSIQIEGFNDNDYGYCTFEVTLSNSRNKNETKKMFVVINQSEGTEFTMSFSFE